MRYLLIVALLVPACGSSSRQTVSDPSTGGGSGMICHEETPTGSSLPRQVCRTPEQVEDQRKGARDMATRHDRGVM
jgi:hypothetical protein